MIEVQAQGTLPSVRERLEIVAPKELDDRLESSTSKLVIKREDFVRFGDTSLVDALRRVPGITVGSGARGVEVRMRGLGSGYTQFLLNGEPVPPGFSIESLSPAMVERVDILRSATADLSTQAVAGSINIILRRPPTTRQRELKVSLASENGQPTVWVNTRVADRDGSLSYSLPLNLGRENFDRPSSFEDTGLDAVHRLTLSRAGSQARLDTIDTFSASPSVAWQPSNGGNLSGESFLRYMHSRLVLSENFDTVLGPPPQYSSDIFASTTDTRTARANLALTHLLDSGGRLESRVGVSYQERRSTVAFQGYDQLGNQLVDRSIRSSASDQTESTTGKYRLPFLREHAVSAGWEGSYSRRLEDRVQREITPIGVLPVNIDESYKAIVGRLALFAQDEWEITPSLITYWGLRWERLASRSVGNVLTEVRNQSTVTSPILQMLLRRTGPKKEQMRLALAQTYKAPNTFDLMPRRYIANNNAPTTPDFQGNPDLRPELSLGIDIAYERRIEQGPFFSVNAFTRRIREVILRELYVSNGTWITRPVNSDQARLSGFEVDCQVSLRSVISGEPDLSVKANMAHNLSKVYAVPGPHNYLDQQVRRSANVGLDYRTSALPLSLAANFSYQSGGPTRLSVTQQSFRSPKRLFELSAIYRFSPSFQARLTAANLLRQRSISTSEYFDANGSLAQTINSQTFPTIRAQLELEL